jgi:membrane-associated protease RseP (regulator of RpoE activity)
VGRLVTLAVFVLSIGFAAPLSAAKDETKKDQTKKEEPSKDAPKKDVKKDKDGTKPEPGRNPGGKAGFQPGGGVPPGPALFRATMRLGARVQPVSAELAKKLELPDGQGMVVRDVVPDSPAAKASLKADDVILEIDGKKVSNRIDELAKMLADIKKDATVDIVVLRKGKKETIKEVKLPEARGFPSGGFPGGRPPVAIPPGGGFGAVVTTIIQTKDQCTVRHQEGNCVITLTGDGAGKVKEILIVDAGRPEKYESVDKVPEKHQDKIKKLIEIGEKSHVKIEKKEDKSKEK